MDMDWASDEILQYAIDFIKTKGVKATIFATHFTELLKEIINIGSEVGIHPDFNDIFEGQGTTMERILQKCMEIVPDAKSVRSHSLTSNSKLSQLFRQNNITHESNVFIPDYKTEIWPFELPVGIIQAPYNWGDYTYIGFKNKILPEQYLSLKGLKIMNVHPIHLFLNTYSISQYNSAKAAMKSNNSLQGFINYQEFGIRNYLECLIGKAKNHNFTFDIISNIHTS